MTRRTRHQKRKQTERKVRGFMILTGMFMVTMLIFLCGFCERKQKNCIGNVEVQLSEPLADKLYGQISTLTVEPGQRLAKDPTVYVKESSEVSYLRIRILWGGLTAQMRELLEKNLALKNGWVKNCEDGFYYYQYPVKGGDQICFFDMLTVPETWTKPQVEVSFCMEFHVEAVTQKKVEVLKNQERKINGWIIL